jgi:aspartate carbamoyltransferase catalytic subunit
VPGLLSAEELDRPRIEALLASAADYRAGRGRRHPDRLVGLVFFEDSLRTRVGFDAAAARLGARAATVVGAKQADTMWAPESLEDTIRSVAGWCDVVCIRHPDASALSRAASLSPVPVINCGDGNREHPTQALIDLQAINDAVGRLDDLQIVLVGDLDGMRAAHSLAIALSRFDDIRLRCITPPGLQLPAEFAGPLEAAGATIDWTAELKVSDADIVYVAGLPAPTAVGVLSREQQRAFRITPEVVAHMRSTTCVLCPLPRVDEIDPAVDGLPQAGYFRQSELALYARMALLDEVFAR